MRFCLLLLIAASFPASAQPPANTRRIIDVHMHIMSSDARWDNKVPNPATGTVPTALNETAHRRATIEQMKRYGVILGVISYENGVDTALLKRWMGTQPELFIPGIGFNLPGAVTTDFIRAEHKARRLSVIGEIGAPWVGYSAGDTAYEKFFALAEELDIPIAVHAGTAGGQATYHGNPKYRMELNRPLLLEDMLARHPNARVDMMHAGWPFADETVALMKLHPQVYVDIGAIGWTQPPEEFHSYLAARFLKLTPDPC
jgi:predicted TIM-barrel fold metal-dependent hydrolase